MPYGYTRYHWILIVLGPKALIKEMWLVFLSIIRLLFPFFGICSKKLELIEKMRKSVAQYLLLLHLKSFFYKGEVISVFL